MRPVSPQFLRTLTGSHRMYASARVLTDFQTGVSPTGMEIPIVTGSVRADATADIRATLSLTTAGYNMWPLNTDDLLAPYGNELWIERGLDYGNGVREIVGLGYYRINTTSQASGPDGQIVMTAADRMVGIVDGRLIEPRQFLPGQSFADVFEDLVLDIYPEAEIVYDFNAEASTLDTSHVAEEDRYGFLYNLARSRGKIMFWDHIGRLQVKSPPDPTIPLYQVNTGRDGIIVELSRSLTRDGVYNAVVATGDATNDEEPVRAVAYDNNPASPTYWNGRFGHVPRFYYSSFITTTLAAQSAAKSILQDATGLPYNIDLTTIPNPALEPYDPIRIVGRKFNETHVIDSITTPLTAQGSMTASTRKLLSFDPGLE